MKRRANPEPSLVRLMARRRSVRKYKTQPVDKRALMRVMRAPFLAPSGADRSGYSFVLVNDSGLKRRIREACEAADADWHRNAAPWLKAWLKKKGITPEKPFLEDAPYLICVFGDNTAPYWLGSTWLAVAYLILAAEREGLATLTYTPGKSRFLQSLLKMDANMVPITILPIGYAAERIPAKSIKLGTRIFLNRYDSEHAVPLR